MPKPLSLFIQPPYTEYSQVRGMGEVPNRPWYTPQFDDSLIVKRNAGSAVLLAATAGMLSVGSPRLSAYPLKPLPPPPQGPLPNTVTLFLHPTPVLELAIVNPGWRERIRVLGINRIAAFCYRNVDVGTLLLQLKPALDATLSHAGPLTDDQKLRHFVFGDFAAWVRRGTAIGTGANRNVEFTIVSDLGIIEPSRFYYEMRSFVDQGEAAVTSFLNVAPAQWPLLGSGTYLTKESAILRTATALYSLPVLQSLRVDHNLNDVDWRTVGNHQKKLYRRLLLILHGHPDAPSTDPPFRFNNDDKWNPFQLEAIAEFYVNYRSPFSVSNPLDPNVVPPPPLPFRHAGPVDLLDAAIPLQLVLVDSAGPRASGNDATVAGPVVTLPAGIDVNLLPRVNPNQDTIFLESDTAPASTAASVHPARIYRINAVDPVARTVTVTGIPNVVGPTAWAIPAGLGVMLPELHYDLRPQGPVGARLGSDHYDGVLFVVKNGEIWALFRWTSYSSRRHAAGGDQSSVRGNDSYDFLSAKSRSKSWINYGFILDHPPHGGIADYHVPGAFYFRTPPAPVGKTGVYIHQGHTNTPADNVPRDWSGSEGCLVSPFFVSPGDQIRGLRDYLIDILHEIRSYDPRPNPHNRDPAMTRIYRVDQQRSREIYCNSTVGAAGCAGVAAPPGGVVVTTLDWDRRFPDLIGGNVKLWLIRPDEIPV